MHVNFKIALLKLFKVDFQTNSFIKFISVFLFKKRIKQAKLN
jgi:hypothetical protein